MGVSEQSLKILNGDMEECRFVSLSSFDLLIYSSKGKRTKKQKNQDSCGFVSPSPAQIAMVVSDGMGGHKSGDKASKIVVNSILGRSTQRRRPFKSAHLVSKIHRAQQQIVEMEGDGGATLVAAVVEGDKLSLYSVGDSVGVLFNNKGQVLYKAFEHSVTGFATESGLIKEEEAQKHDQSHIILNALGFSDSRMEMSFKLNFSANDTVVLCTDGLTELLTIEEIIGSLSVPLESAGPLIVEKCQSLRQKRDDFDDLSFIVCRKK